MPLPLVAAAARVPAGPGGLGEAPLDHSLGQAGQPAEEGSPCHTHRVIIKSPAPPGQEEGGRRAQLLVLAISGGFFSSLERNSASCPRYCSRSDTFRRNRSRSTIGRPPGEDSPLNHAKARELAKRQRLEPVVAERVPITQDAPALEDTADQRDGCLVEDHHIHLVGSENGHRPADRLQPRFEQVARVGEIHGHVAQRPEPTAARASEQLREPHAGGRLKHGPQVGQSHFNIVRKTIRAWDHPLHTFQPGPDNS